MTSFNPQSREQFNRGHDMADGVQLLDLIEQSKLDGILEAFTQATGVAAVITDVDGTPITKYFNFTNLCKKYCRETPEGRERCYKSDSFGGQESARTRDQVIYHCLNAGLLDSAAPIFVGGRHVGTTLCGQVLDAPMEREEAIQRAQAIGIDDVDGYLENLAQIPIIPLERFKAVVRLMNVMTHTFSELAYQRRLLLRRSRRYLDNLVNSLSEGIVSTNNKGIITMINDACVDLFQAPRKSLLGRSFGSLLADEDSIDTVVKQLDARSDVNSRFKVKAVNNSGAKISLQISITKIGNEKGHVSDYVAVLRDITEERRAERMKEDLIGMLTHDLGNPVLSIQKALQLLMHESLGGLNSAQKGVLELTYQTGNQLYGMVTDFLDTYRHENGQFRLRKIDGDLCGLLRESIEQVDLFAKDKKIRLMFVPPDDAVICSFDYNRVKRVVINILENAIKYSPEEGEVKVILEQKTGGDLLQQEEDLPDRYHKLASAGQIYWQVSVTDEGMGIPKGVLPYIFDKFFTTRQLSRQGRKGVGLGLSFCQLAVEAHGGGIWVKTPLFSDKSFNSRGCRFNFVLPV